MKDKFSRLSAKSAVCVAAAMLCLGQPVWGSSFSTGPATAQSQLGSEKSATSGEIPTGATLSSEQAEQVVKKLFPVLGKAKVSHAEYREADQIQSGVKVWDLYFSLRNEGMGGGIGAGVNAVTGELVHIYLPHNLIRLADTEGMPELSREEAGIKGLDWIRQNIKSIKVDRLSEKAVYWGQSKSLFSPVTYEFNYNLPLNGIPSDTDTVQFAVDSYGNLVSFSRMQTSAKAVSSKPKLSAEEMRKMLEGKLNAELAYVPTYLDYEQRGAYYLAYLQPETASSQYDADTGERLNYQGKPDKDESIAPVPVKTSKVTYTASPKPLGSSEEAVKWAESQLAVPKGFKADYKTLSSYRTGKDKVWRINWTGPKPKKGYSENISAELNAKTGQIYSYSRYSYRPLKDEKGKTVDITAPKARQTAMELASRLVPDASKEWKLTRVSLPPAASSNGDYTFTFNRYAEDIMIYGEHLSFTVSRDGTLKQFNCSTYADPAKLPLGTKAKITPDEAKTAYAQAMELQLKYAQFGGPDPAIAKLVYMVSHKHAGSYDGVLVPLDAVTGEWREFYPGMTSQAKSAVDTKGHKYQNQLDKLVKFGVLIPDQEGKVYPDQEITTGDWYTMVARAVNPQLDRYPSSGGESYGALKAESPYYQAVMSVVSQGWLSSEPAAEFSTDRKLTRDELAPHLMRMLRYEKLARSFTEGDPVPGAGDSSVIANRGAAIIAVKLGLLPVVDGKFMPEHVLSRGEAADVLVRLAAMAGKGDSFMNNPYGG